MSSLLSILLPTLLGIVQQIPALVADVESVVNLLGGKTTLTPEQRAAIDAALDAAHQKLQQQP